jgi:hypothetical protein
MALTSKDLQIINQALAQYEAMLEDGYDEETGKPNNSAYDYHKEQFGNPVKTVEATRLRVHKEINKRERTCT